MSNIKQKELDLPAFLKQLVGKSFIYIPNPGNAGDALIMYGTLQLFERLGLSYTIGDIKRKYTNELLVLAGGGSLVGLYAHCKNFLLANKDSNFILILPHTFKDEDELLKGLGNNCIIICREKISYKYVHKIARHKGNVYLSQDMAFYIDLEDRYKNVKSSKICNCFRSDKESTAVNIPHDNNDISETLKNNTWMKSYKECKKTALHFFDYLSQCHTINTNRLHVAIAGSILNKQVFLHNNSYYKNRAIYDYSLKKNPNIVFVR
jgi:exopolysaccharide biosynthesis predicted pyruvyltransferase EpsI